MASTSRPVNALAHLLLAAAILLLGLRQNDQAALVLDGLKAVDIALITLTVLGAGIVLKWVAPAPVSPWSGLDRVVSCAPALALILVWLQRDLWLAAGLTAICAFAQFLLLPRLIIGSTGIRPAVLSLAVSFLLWVLLYGAITISPVSLPRSLGSATLTFLFFAFTAISLQAFVRFPRALLPVFLLAASAFVFHENGHQIGLQDYEIADVETSTDRVRHFVSVPQTFQTWLLSRNDLDDYRRRGIPYPVFLVASQGGGGYAAAHANLFLTKLQAKCPNFAQHLFATIGVSGGAVGNAMFMARLGDKTNLAESQGCSSAPTDDRLVRDASADHLAPLLAALFFRDFPNKVFFGLLGGPDRSAALKASIIDTLGSEVVADPLSWDQYWKTEKDKPGWALGEKPALIAVATNATSGRRFVFAPFSFSAPDGRFEEALQSLNTLNEHDSYQSKDVHVLDAAIASASFPYVTPSRALGGVSLVDGGYIENDGAETARDLLAELQSPNPYFDGATIMPLRMPDSYLKRDGMGNCSEPRLVYVPVDVMPRDNVSVTDSPADEACRVEFTVHVISIRSEVPQELKDSPQNFFLDPVTSLLSARARRGETARFALLSQLCGAYNCPPQVEDATIWQLHESVIRTDQLTLPLGWYLSADRIAALSDCVAPDANEEFDIDDGPSRPGLTAILEWQSRKFSTMKENPYIMSQIFKALDPEGKASFESSKTVTGHCKVFSKAMAGME